MVLGVGYLNTTWVTQAVSMTRSPRGQEPYLSGRQTLVGFL